MKYILLILATLACLIVFAYGFYLSVPLIHAVIPPQYQYENFTPQGKHATNLMLWGGLGWYICAYILRPFIVPETSKGV